MKCIINYLDKLSLSCSKIKRLSYKTGWFHRDYRVIVYRQSLFGKIVPIFSYSVIPWYPNQGKVVGFERFSDDLHRYKLAIIQIKRTLNS